MPKHSVHIHSPLELRFWAKVDKTPGRGPWGDCWLWTGATAGKDWKKTEGGYGKLNDGSGQSKSVHRIAWELETGKAPELPVLHRCDMRRCVRFSHLFLGTFADNNEDMRQKGRKWTKLTAEQAIEIRVRALAGEAPKALAFFYRVSEGLIRHIRDGRNWTHV